MDETSEKVTEFKRQMAPFYFMYYEGKDSRLMPSGASLKSEIT